MDKKDSNAVDAAAVGNAAELSIDELQQQLKCTTDGLAVAEVQPRLTKFGYNELPAEKVNPLLKFLTYFWGPIPWMIEVAVVLSALVQHWADFGIILALLVANAMVGFWEEFQAGNAIAALQAKLALNARVKRGGRWGSVPARELVPGDVIRVRLGDIVPADAKLLTGDSVEVDQSALTGESLPVTRKPDETVYSGSIIKQGEIDALVYGTGGNTYFGRTAHLVETAHTASHFQKAVLKIGDFLIVIAVALVILILLVALFRGDPMLETLQFALVLTVAAIPVAMPTVLSVTMAVGARVLARCQAIVSRLASIEELAGMDVLCSDKTGTLTQNKLTLGEPFLMDGISKDELLLAAALASRAENQDAIDEAVLAGSVVFRSAKERPFAERKATDYQVVHFQPFDPIHKRTETTVHASDGGEFKTSKGAPQVILDLVANRETIREKVDATVNQFAARGFRSLAVAQYDDRNQWRFLGVLPLYDPPREDSKSTIATARQMGCSVRMVTGDQLAIGREIAAQLDLGRDLVDAKVFQETSYHESAKVDDLIEHADGFAQVFPEHKFHIVDVLQRHGHIVGMTGDGVNDAPALKKADCGIATVGADLKRTIEIELPAPDGGKPDAPPVEIGQAFMSATVPVAASSGGYIQAIDYNQLVHLAQSEDLAVRLTVCAGDFLVRGDIVALLPATNSPTSDLAREVNSALVVGIDRTHEQDIEFPINQLVQLAIRALSPAINDPITAIIAIEQLRAGLCNIAERSSLSSVILDAEGVQRLLVKRQDAAHNVEAVFSLIRQYGRGSLEVTISLLDAIEQVSRRTTDETFRGALLHQATLIEHGAQSALPEEADRKQVAERFQRLLGLFLLLAFLVALVEFNILVYAYVQMGVHPRYVTSLLLLSLLGASINIPVAQLPEEKTVENRVVRYAGVEYVVPAVRHWPGTIIAVNVGGAVIPTLLSIYLIVKNRLFVRGVLGTAIVALLVHQFAYPVKGLGIATPTMTPPLIAATVGLLLGWRKAAPLAYAAGCLGTLIGADLMNLGAIRGLGAPVASIGGAGTYDGIFVTGILAFLLTWSPHLRPTRETPPHDSES